MLRIAKAEHVARIFEDKVLEPAARSETRHELFTRISNHGECIGSVLAVAWDQNAAMRVMSPAAPALEEIAGKWLLDLLRLPARGSYAFVSGATMASFTCLAAARHALLSRVGWDVEADGLFGAPPLQVVVSDEVHVSVLKALSLLELGRQRVQRVPTDSQGRIRADFLPSLDSHTILCTQAGNVNTRSFDPFESICEAARSKGAWVHVDGAFGLWAAASPEQEPLVRGIADADSWATDGWPTSSGSGPSPKLSRSAGRLPSSPSRHGPCSSETARWSAG